jgi:hypothetical protein
MMTSTTADGATLRAALAGAARPRTFVSESEPEPGEPGPTGRVGAAVRARSREYPGRTGTRCSGRAASAALNLAEGNGRSGQDRVQHFRIALGSAREAASGARILAAAGKLGRADADELLGLQGRVAAMTFRLSRGRP